MRKLSLTLILLFSLALVACGDSTATPSAAGATTTPTATPTQVSGTPASNNTQTSFPDIASVVERAAPAVVQVLSTMESQNTFGQTVESTAQGSGVFFRDDGYILTNNHVVEGAKKVEIAHNDSPRMEVEVVGTDPRTDLAVLKVDPKDITDYTWVPLGDTDAMRIGDWVVAIGSPLGFEGSVTQGIISAKNRSLPVESNKPPLHDLVQTDAVINPGNSGGPLLNLNGEVIAINTAIIRGNIGNNQQAEGLGFAVGMGTAKPVAEQIIANGRVIRPGMGVSILDVTPAIAAERGLSVEDGVLVDSVVEGAPAAEADIKSGDVITMVDDHTIAGTTELVRLFLTDYKVGDTVTITVVRDGVTQTFDVTLEELSG